MLNCIYIFLLKRLSILLVALFVFAEKSSAQNYQSVFGENNTSWNIVYTIFDGIETDSVFEIGTDTVFNSIPYRKIYDPSGNVVGFLREDTLTGKVWYYHLNNNALGLEFLIMDMSLNLNDTFAVQIEQQDSLVNVDSVYYLNNRKYIRLNFNLFNRNEKLTFIEGIGTNAGLYYQNYNYYYYYLYLFDYYLLCKYNDIVNVYLNTLYVGVCSIFASGIQKSNEKKDFEIFPNPLTNNKKLSIKTAKTGNYKLSIYDICGRLQLISPFENSMNEFDMNFENGVYTVVIEDALNKYLERYKIIIN